MGTEVISQLLSQAFVYFCSPLHLIILILTGVLVYTILKQRAARMARYAKAALMQMDPVVQTLIQDLTLEELREYDGTQHGGRILIAVKGRIYDASKANLTHGPGALCVQFAGHDMTHFFVRPNEPDDHQMMFDDFSDLTDKEMELVQIWEDQIREEFPCVGKVKRSEESSIDYAREIVDSDDQHDLKDSGNTVVYTHGLEKLD